VKVQQMDLRTDQDLHDTAAFGEIPSHWKSVPLKRIADFVGRGNAPQYAIESAVRVVNQACVQADGFHIENVKYHIDEDVSGFKGLLKNGDLLLNSTGTGTLGRCCVFDMDGKETGPFFADSHVTIIRDSRRRFLPRFLYYLLSTKQEWITAYAAEGATNQIELQRERLRSLKVPVPPLAEQSAIVRFLDSKYQKIDLLISKKRRLIELLNEQRLNVVTHYVTRGTEQRVATNDSGTMFVGKVPAHWDVRRAKYFFQEIDERSVAGDEELLSVSHITGVTPRSVKSVTMFMAESYEGAKVCRPGDLAVNTMWAWMGAMGVSRHLGLVSPSYAVYRQRSEYYDPDYLDFLVRARPYVAEYLCRSTGIQESRLRMYPDDFFAVRLICPPLSEQIGIVDRIRKETRRLDQLIMKAQREIDLVNEYRTALTFDVATGKVDVCEACRSASGGVS
jgi:type I restriction enzyme, S subunit